MRNQSGNITIVQILSIAVATVVALVVLMMWGLPHYGVYSQRLKGEAELAQANYSDARRETRTMRHPVERIVSWHDQPRRTK